jgi:hypothetical protein
MLSTCGVPQRIVAPCMKVTLPVGNGAVVCPAAAGTVAVKVTAWLTVVEGDDGTSVIPGAFLTTVSVKVTGALTVKFESPE